jgi:hypothetical protein
MHPDETLETMVGPLDAVRRAAIQLALACRPLAFLYARRDRRVAAHATLAIVASAVLSVVAPVVVFSLAPLVLGVPHVASDVRYLLLRRRLPSTVLRVALGTCAGLVALRGAEVLWGETAILVHLELGVAFGFVAIAAVAGASSSRGRTALAGVLAALAVLAPVAFTHPSMARLVFAHAHNLVAVLLWVALFRRSARLAFLPLTVLIAAAAVLTSGATLPLTERLGGDHALGLSLSSIATWLAPGLGASLASGVVVSFVFLQGVHYGVWLGWIPQEDVGGEGTLSFRMSIRSAFRDFGRSGLVLVALGVALVAAFALRDLHRTRDVYLSLATFHGYLELAALAFFTTAHRVDGPRDARLAMAAVSRATSMGLVR